MNNIPDSKQASQSEIHPARREAAPLGSISYTTEHILTSLDTRQTATERPPSLHDANHKSASTADGPQALTQPRSKLRLTFILLALFLSLFVAAIDATLTATAVPVITHDLNSATGYAWIGGAYLLAHAVAAPIWGKLSDIWGRKLIMLAGIAMFFASSVMTATATSMRSMIAGRALQGVAAGGILLLVHVVISDIFSMRLRSLFMGLTEGVWAIAGGLGPPLGGIFATLVNWRWCFWINLPICGVAFILIVLFLDVKHEKTNFKTGIKAIDWWGIFTFLAFTLLVLLGLDFGGDIFAWNSAKVLCLIFIGVAMLGAFIYSEAKVARYPLVPLSVFKDKSNLAAMGVTFFHGAAFISGILLVPLVVATALTGILTGIIIHKTGRFRELIWLGTSLLTIACGLFIMLDPESSVAELVGLSIIFGCGSGMLFEPPLIAIQTRVAQDDVATATGTFSFIRSIALSISLIIGGAVFSNSMDLQAGHLEAIGLPSDMLHLLSGKEAAANVALSSSLTDEKQRATIENAFSWSMRNMWIMYCVLSGLGVISSCFVAKSKLSKEHVETVTGIKSEMAKTTGGNVEMVRV